MPENYGHQGYDVPVPGIITIDWGTGTSCFGYVNYYEKVGDLVIDLDHEIAYGVNAIAVKRCHVNNNNVTLDLEIIPEKKDIMVKLLYSQLQAKITGITKVTLNILNLNKQYVVEMDSDSKKIPID